MTQVTIQEAEQQIAKLIERAAQGEEIVTRDAAFARYPVQVIW